MNWNRDEEACSGSCSPHLHSPFSRSPDVPMSQPKGDAHRGAQGNSYAWNRHDGFDPPQMLGRFKVEDGVTLTVRGVAKLVNEGA